MDHGSRTPASFDLDALLESPAQTRWLRSLAGRLVADRDARDDAVQESWIAAWRRGDALLRPRAFLAAFLRGAALHHDRASQRRSRRERDAAPPRAPADPAVLVEYAELLGILARHVAALEPPYREAIVLRYVEELEPAEISARLGVPAATIRSRVHRGLALLRADLDRTHAGRSREWLAGMAAVALPAARRGGAADWIGRFFGWMGAAMRGKPWVFGAFVVLTGGAAWMFVQTDVADGRVERRAVAEDPRAPAGVMTAPTGVASSGAAAAPVREAVAGSVAPTGTRPAPRTSGAMILDGIVVDIAGTALPGARVDVCDDSRAGQAAAGPGYARSDVEDATGRGVVAVATSDAAGRFHVELGPESSADPRDLSFHAIRPGYVGDKTYDPAAVEQRITMFATCVLEGRVVDARGAPLPGIEVGPTSSPPGFVVTDSAGAFRLEDILLNRASRLRTRPPGAVWVEHSFVIPRPEQNRIDFVEPERIQLRGRVVDAGRGSAVAGCALGFCASTFLGVARRPDWTELGTTDAAGRFELSVPATPDPSLGYPGIVFAAAGYKTGALGLRGRVAGEDLVIPLLRACELEVIVRSVDCAAGEPVGLPDARVSIRAASAMSAERIAQLAPGAPDGYTPTTPGELVLRADSNGVVRLTDLAPLHLYEIRAMVPNTGRGAVAIVMTGDPSTQLKRSMLSILVPPAPAPVAGWIIEGVLSFNGLRGPIPYAYSGGGTSGKGHADPEGVFRIEGDGAGPVELVVSVPGIVERKVRVPVAMGETATCDVDLKSATSFVSGALLDAARRHVPHATLTILDPASAWRTQATTDAFGRFQSHTAVRPGTPLRVLWQRGKNDEVEFALVAGTENAVLAPEP